MDTNGGNSTDDRIIRYLDGSMTQEERSALEKELEHDERLRGELEFQRRVFLSLRDHFEHVSMPDSLLLAITHSKDRISSHHSRWSGIRRSVTRIMVVSFTAAAILLVAYANFPNEIMRHRRHSPPPPFVALPVADIYQQAVKAGFQPLWKCDNEQEFRNTFAYRHGTALELGDLPSGSEMVGLSYMNAISPKTTTMLARVEGKPVLVFVVNRKDDPHPRPPVPETGLHLLHRPLEDLALYELTPLPEKSILGSLRIPSTSAANQSP